MTEDKWNCCMDPTAMLGFLRFKLGVRKLRLFTVACYRREWHRLDDPARRDIESAEQLAEDRERIASHGLRAAHMDATAAFHAAKRASFAYSVRTAPADLLRDIIGPLPFRSVPIDESWLHWSDGTVVKIAQAIYDERRFEDVPILADALEESGCIDAELLGHLRGPGPHVKGCWAIDLLLGKE